MSVNTDEQEVLLFSKQERAWDLSSSSWSLRNSHIATRGASLFSSTVWFPNGSLGRSSAEVGTAKPITVATTVTNTAICIFRPTPDAQTPDQYSILSGHRLRS